MGKWGKMRGKKIRGKMGQNLENLGKIRGKMGQNLWKMGQICGKMGKILWRKGVKSVGK